MLPFNFHQIDLKSYAFNKIPNVSNPYILKHKIKDFSSHTHKEQHQHINLSYQTQHQHIIIHSNKIIMH